MFPISLLPFILDSGLLSNILKSFLILNPATFLLTSVLILGVLSLKTLSAKLTFLGISMFVSSVITYIVHKKNQKDNKKQQEKKSFIEHVDSENSQEHKSVNNEEKELVLSKIFKR